MRGLGNCSYIEEMLKHAVFLADSYVIVHTVRNGEESGKPPQGEPCKAGFV
jgi:hypothetical protein